MMGFSDDSQLLPAWWVCGGPTPLPSSPLQHKKLSVEGGISRKDFRKGEKQGDLHIWDPVDQVT